MNNKSLVIKTPCEFLPANSSRLLTWRGKGYTYNDRAHGLTEDSVTSVCYRTGQVVRCREG